MLLKGRILKKEFSKTDEGTHTDKIKKGRSNRIRRIAESISNNIDNGRKIWEVKWRVKRKHQTPHFIINSQGRKIKKKKKY